MINDKSSLRAVEIRKTDCSFECRVPVGCSMQYIGLIRRFHFHSIMNNDHNSNLRALCIILFITLHSLLCIPFQFQRESEIAV